MTPAQENLLEPAIALAAGLHGKFNRRSIGEQIAALPEWLERIETAHRRLAIDRTGIAIGGLDQIETCLQSVKRKPVMFAGSQLGPPLVTLAALAAVGLKIAGVYWHLSARQRRIVAALPGRFLDLNEVPSPLSLVRSLHMLQESGHVLWLMCDAPGGSSRRYDFLGYRVRCAPLIEAYARLYRCAVVPISSRLLSGAEASVHCGPPLTGCDNLTGRLLSSLETAIYRDHTNYLWSGASIIFSDPRAIENGLRILPDYLEWRDRFYGKTRAGKPLARTRMPPSGLRPAPIDVAPKPQP